MKLLFIIPMVLIGLILISELFIELRQRYLEWRINRMRGRLENSAKILIEKLSDNWGG